MIEIDIPSIDPMQHEAKIFLGMTSRQCLCIAPGAIIGISLFMALKGFSMDLAMVSLLVTIVPAVMMGWYKPYNMKCEDFLKLMWFNTFVANPKRIKKNEDDDSPVATTNISIGMKKDKKSSKLKKSKNEKEAS